MSEEINKLLATMRPAAQERATRYNAKLQQRPVQAWEIIECVKRLLKGQELTTKEAEELHELVRQNTRRGKR